MVLYSCIRCGYSTEHKHKYDRHVSRKNPCSEKKETNHNSSQSKKLHQNAHFLHQNAHFLHQNPSFQNDCMYCGKIFTRNSSLRRHMESSCKILKSQWMTMDEESRNLETENKLLKQQLTEMKASTITNNNNNNSHNTTNNTNIINQQININGFGNEDTSYLTSELVNKYIDAPYSAIPNLLKSIHFHPQHPENHNVKITNKKEPYARVYEDNKWQIKDRQTVVEYIRDKGKMLLDGYRDEDTHSDFKNKCYNDFSSRLENDDKLLLKKVFKDIELLIINNSI